MKLARVSGLMIERALGQSVSAKLAQPQVYIIGAAMLTTRNARPS